MILAGFAVAVGVVVDDAIIDMENIVRRLRLREAAASPEPLLRTILRASLEVRGAIFYATLINVVAVVPVLFVGGLTGSFFQPLALSYALAVLVSMLVALTVTPALSLILLSHGRRAAASRCSSAGSSAGTAGRSALVIRRPADRVPDRRRRAAHGPRGPSPPRRGVVPGLQGARLPHALDHGAGDVDPRGAAHRDAREPRAARPAGSPRLRLAHRPGVPRRGDRGVELRRELGQRRPQGRLRQDRRTPAQRRQPPPRPVPQRPDLSARAHRRGARRRERADRGEDLRRRPRQVLREHRATGSAKSLSTIDGMEGLHVSLQAEVPQIDVRVKLGVARRYGVKPGDVRRAAGTLVAGEEVGDMFQDGVSTNVMVWSTPRRATASRRSATCRSTRRATGRSRSPTLADVAIQPDAERHPARERLAADRRRSRPAEGPRPRRRDPRHPGAARPDEAPARLPRGAPRRGGRAAEGAAAAADLRVGAAVAIFLLLQVAFGSWRLAMRCSSRSRWRSSAACWPPTPASGRSRSGR